MSRSYQRHSSYNKRGKDNNVAFPIILLLACAVWVHKAVMLKIEHYAAIAALLIAGVIGFAVLLSSSRKITTFKTKSSISSSNIDTMTGLEFEKYVANLLKRHGFKNVKLTEEYDLGVDVIAHKDGITWGVQVKRYSGLVKAEAVRQVVTALKFYGCDRAMVITNSTFSRPAVELADSNDCVLVGRTGLLQMTSS